MGYKMLWTGLTITTLGWLVNFSWIYKLGSIIMVIGCVMIWLDTKK